MMTCKPDKRKIVLLGLYMLVILFLSLLPMNRDIKAFQILIDLDSVIQNLMHVPVYALLAVLGMQIFSIYTGTFWKTVSIVATFSVGFGILLEFLQLIIPGRYPSAADMVLNSVGALIGILFYFIVERKGSGLIKRLVCE